MLRRERMAHQWIQMWVMYWHTAQQFESSFRYLSLKMQAETELARQHYATADAIQMQIDELHEQTVMALLKPIDLFGAALHQQGEFQNVLSEVNRQAHLYPEFIELRRSPSYGF